MENEKRVTDTEKVLEWLKEKGSITPMDALRGFGCYRLGARIWDLRHRFGVMIRTEWVKSDAGEKYARYVLEEGTLF